MTLRELLSGLQAKHLSGPADLEIASVCYDSRKVTDGSLFVAIKGFRNDGHQYIAKALELGAAAVLVQDTPRSLCPKTSVSGSAKIPAPHWRVLPPSGTVIPSAS